MNPNDDDERMEDEETEGEEEEEGPRPDAVALAPVAPQDSVTFSKARMAYQGRGKTGGLKDKRVPQRVVAADYASNEPISADDIDDDTIIAPGKKVIGNAYASTNELKGGGPKGHTPVAESTSGNDILALQAADDRTGQTISFKVKGIQWKSGWSLDFAKTPLGHAIHPLELPPPSDETPEALQKAGIVIRAVNPRLQVVLSQLLPGSFRKSVFKARGKCERLKQLSIFYLPSPHSSSVGFVHEFTAKKTDDTFFLYIQTSVGKAPVAILDEVLKTLEAGLPEGEKADDYEYDEEDVPLPEPEFNFVSEVEQSMKQAKTAVEDSIMVHVAKQSGFLFKNWFADYLRWIDKNFARIIRMITAVFVMIADSWLVRGIAGVLNFFGNIFVQIIWGINKGLLAIGRSALVKALLEGINKFFEGLAKIFGFVGEGLGAVGRGVGSLFGLLGTLFTAPGEFFTEIPKIKIGAKEFFGEKPKREKSSLKAKAAAKSVSSGSTSTPATQKAISASPKSPLRSKPAKPPAGIQPTNNLRRQAKAPPPPPKKKPLGYFEDE